MPHGAIKLEPGGNMSLTASNPLLKELVVGFGWNVIKANGPLTDLVPSALMVGEDGNALSDEHLVFFNQLATPDDAVRYVTDDDTEQIEIDLSLIPDEVKKIVFIVYADPDTRQPGNFGSVRDPYIRVADHKGGEIVRYDIAKSNTSITAMIFAEIYRYKEQWKFRAIGEGFTDGLVGVAKAFKVNL